MGKVEKLNKQVHVMDNKFVNLTFTLSKEENIPPPI